MTEQITPISSEDEYIEFITDKNQTWEKNHALIIKAMSILVRQNERIPSNAEIAERTGLSRPTIYKHLKEFSQCAIIDEQLEQVTFMSSKVLAKIIEMAMDGDIKAARLSLEIMGILKRNDNSNRVIPGVEP